jgi:hypothetical protein
MVCFSGGIIGLSRGKTIRAAVFVREQVGILNTGMNVMIAKGRGNIRGIGKAKRVEPFKSFA